MIDIEKRYEETVYAGVLGKIIGVYMGRPVEGWSYEDIKKTCGLIKGYVNKERNLPLVLIDDDISGTFTFIRSLEDSNLYEKTKPDFFGKTWLNYIIENETILWFGHKGRSTEHTAYLRLLEGYSSPESGSASLNGPIVANQIGAQIFIDAFGMVAPGEPDLAEYLARMAASVSHDKDAVDAAASVASMISIAFVEKNMEKIIECGKKRVSKSELLVKLYDDVQNWSKKYKDWEDTFKKIKEKYGYDKYGGGCHIIPNHAVILMSLLYSSDSFYKSQIIVNSAGWDTDCNAANVGAIMGIKLGYQEINKDYDFQTPFADTVLLPSAEGTYGVSDALEQTLLVCRIGRKIMKWQNRDLLKNNALHYFSLPGSLHGYTSFSDNSYAKLQNKDKNLDLIFDIPQTGGTVRVSTPIMVMPSGVGYGFVATPKVYSGMIITIEGFLEMEKGQNPNIRLFITHRKPKDNPAWQKFNELEVCKVYSEEIQLKTEEKNLISFTVPDTKGFAVDELGFEISSSSESKGMFKVDSVRTKGKFYISFNLWNAGVVKKNEYEGTLHGFISTMDFFHWHSNNAEWDFKAVSFGKDKSDGFLVTGNKFWKDYSVSSSFSIVLADGAGLVVRYQGLERWIGIIQTQKKLLLVERFYKERILKSIRSPVKLNESFTLEVKCEGATITVLKNNKIVVKYKNCRLLSGGAGFITRKGAASAYSLEIKEY